MVGHDELAGHEVGPVPAPDADKEGDRPGRAAEARRLRVEADEWPSGIDRIRQPTERLQVDRQRRATLDDDDRP